MKNSEANDDLFYCLKPVLIMGKLVLTFPITGILEPNSNKLRFRWINLWTLMSLLFITISVVFWIFLIYEAATIKVYRALTDVMVVASDTTYIFMIIFVDCYFLLYIKRFINILKKWTPICDSLLLREKDHRLKNDVLRICFLFWSFSIGDLILSSLICCLKGKDNYPDNSFLKSLYDGGCLGVSRLLPYSPYLSVMSLLYDTCLYYSWNLIDIILAVLARALYHKFDALARKVATKMETWDEKLELGNRQFLEKVRKDFLTITELVSMVEKLVSPIIFVAYYINVVLICKQLFLWITPGEKLSTLENIYNVASFIVSCSRVCVVSHLGGKVHSSALGLIKNLQKCPDTSSSIVQRLEHMMMLSPVGLTGLNLFLLKRDTFVSMVNLIFTLEIMLLQTNASFGGG